MELRNTTPYVARLLRVELAGDPDVRAAVIIKATYDLDADGARGDALRPAVEPMPIVPGRLETAFGTFHGEMYPSKDGADLCVLGTVRRARAVHETFATLRVGAFEHRLRIRGDRRWRRAARRAGGLEATAPRPFTEMLLGYDRAFGGRLDVPTQRPPWPDNPAGVGYYPDAAAAEDQPLPNVEPGDGPFVAQWDDRPPVAGWGPYPMFWGLRARAAIDVDATRGRIEAVHRSLFNHAHPALVRPEVRPGALVRVDGLHERRIEFAVPDDAPELRVRVGGEEQAPTATLDGVFVWADARKVVVTWRAVFKYQVRAREARTVDIAPSPRAARRA
jgi:hypothetical protein